MTVQYVSAVKSMKSFCHRNETRCSMTSTDIYTVDDKWWNESNAKLNNSINQYDCESAVCLSPVLLTNKDFLENCVQETVSDEEVDAGFRGLFSKLAGDVSFCLFVGFIRDDDDVHAAELEQLRSGRRRDRTSVSIGILLDHFHQRKSTWDYKSHQARERVGIHQEDQMEI